MEEKTLVLIPAYNEAPRLAGVIAGVCAAVSGVDILVVNDGSTDQTAQVARAAGAIVVTHPYNMGYGAALQTGYKYAHRHHYAIVVQMDGDGQHEPKCIPDLLHALKQQKVDIVLGSRWLSHNTYHDAWLRKFGKFFFGFLAGLVTHYKVTDPTTGFQALTRPVFDFFCGEVYPSDYPDADVIVMLHRAGFRVAEAPVTMYPNSGGHSMHSGLRPLYYGIKMMLSIGMTLLRDDRRLRDGVNYE